jgi:hypothetical protein
MANTYELIASTVVSGTATKTVTFSSIPATYNDFILKGSARATSGFLSQLQYTVNGDTANLRRIRMEATGSSFSGEYRSDNNSQIFINGTTVADTFSYVEIYFPNYSGTALKPFFGDYAFESSGTTAYSGGQGNIFIAGSAIESFALTAETGNFADKSSFFLYGIKNS